MISNLKESSTNARNLQVLTASCQVNEVLKSISPRWKMQLLHSIANQVQQFGQLKKAFPSLSDQVLGKRLGELAAEGLVRKAAIADTMPPQVLYSPTTKGQELLVIMLELHLWGKKHRFSTEAAESVSAGGSA